MRSQAPSKEGSNAVIHLSRRQPSRLHPSLKRARGNVHWQSLVHGVCARQALEQRDGEIRQCAGRKTTCEGSIIRRSATARRQASSDAPFFVVA